MTDHEYMIEAREWLEEVIKLAGLAKDEKWYQKRLKTLEWLIEQAEKADRYESVLEFYADEETYETKFATDTDEIYDPFTLIELDEGKKARQALEGKE